MIKLAEIAETLGLKQQQMILASQKALRIPATIVEFEILSLTLP